MLNIFCIIDIIVYLNFLVDYRDGTRTTLPGVR